MENLSVREWIAAVAGTVAFVVGAMVAAVLYARDALPPWAGWVLAIVAILGLVLLVATTVRALLRGDTEGVERHDAARASMVTVLVIVVAGLGYALLEAFAGLPRLTAAVPAAAAILVWIVVFTWDRRGGETE